MAFGKTVEMIIFSRQMEYRQAPDRPSKVRNRSLRGKARIKARRTKK